MALMGQAEPGRTGLITPEEIAGQPAKRNLAQLTTLVKTRLKRMQRPPSLLDGYLVRCP